MGIALFFAKRIVSSSQPAPNYRQPKQHFTLSPTKIKQSGNRTNSLNYLLFAYRKAAVQQNSTLCCTEDSHRAWHPLPTHTHTAGIGHLASFHHSKLGVPSLKALQMERAAKEPLHPSLWQLKSY